MKGRANWDTGPRGSNAPSMRTPTIEIPFGVIETLSQFLKIGGHGRGKASPATGLFAGEKAPFQEWPQKNSADEPWRDISINTTAWTAGSSLLSLGLSAPQAMGCVVGVAIISALVAVLAGWPGSHLYLGFTVLCRASWGMRGGFWPVLNRIMTACVWMGIQVSLQSMRSTRLR